MPWAPCQGHLRVVGLRPCPHGPEFSPVPGENTPRSPENSLRDAVLGRTAHVPCTARRRHQPECARYGELGGGSLVCRPRGTSAARPAPPCLAIMCQTLATPPEGSPMRKRGSEDYVHVTIRLPRALYDALHATVRQRFPQWGQTDRPADSRLIRAALRHYIACPDGNQQLEAEVSSWGRPHD